MVPFEEIRIFLQYENVKDSIDTAIIDKAGQEYIFRDCPYIDLGNKVMLFTVSDGMKTIFVTEFLLTVWKIEHDEFMNQMAGNFPDKILS